MGIFWVIRLILLLFLLLFSVLGVYFLQRRDQFRIILNNRIGNFGLVVTWNICCYLAAGLPSDNPFFSSPPLFSEITFLTTLLIIGLIFIIIGINFMVFTIKARKSLGAEVPDCGLITTGLYTFSRHPVYLGIILVSFGIAAVFGSFEGILSIIPITLIHYLQGKVEELYDVGVRYEIEYRTYQKQVRMFGPVRIWILVFTGVGIALTLTVLV